MATTSASRSALSSSWRKLRERFVAVVRLWIDLFAEHQLLNSASAISFQALKSLVPLTLFGAALLGALELSDVWTNTLAQTIRPEVTPSAFRAIDVAVRKIFADGSPALPFFAGALLLWYASGLVRACMSGMNLIYAADEQRPFLHRWGISVVLALALAVAVVGSVLAFTVGPRIGRHGATHVVFLLVRWPLAVALLGLAVGLIVHYGPATRRMVRWASVGTTAAVAGWIVESLLFGWYASSLANFKSASGALIVFLVLAAFIYAAAIIFLVGVEIDELLRKDATAREVGILGLLRRGIGARA